MRCWIILALTLSVACGDDDEDTDAGTDASRDTSVDATEEDTGTDIGPDTFDAGMDGGGPRAITLCDPGAEPEPYPAVDAWSNNGPGGPMRSFTEEELYTNCSFLSGGPTDIQHHNLVAMFDGYLIMPWAPCFGDGGITLWDISDPCAPVLRGRGLSETMRESHSIGFSNINGRWAVVNAMDLIALTPGAGGVEFWDLSDTTNPERVSMLRVPGFLYFDAYARITFSVFWQAPYVYVAAADSGLYIIDATDPRMPTLVGEYSFEPTLRAGQIQAVGNLLIVTASEGARTVLLDISDPENPMPIPGGDFIVRDSEGDQREAYFTNSAGGFVYYARKSSGSGILVYDIRDPENPTYAGDIVAGGSGGYVFIKDGLAFEGAGSVAYIFDVSDPAAITEVAQLNLQGDLDTITPIGNVAVLSVDDEADEDRGSAIAPYQQEPDSQSPTMTWAWPADGSTVAATSRFGLTFSEFIDPGSAYDGNVRLYRTSDSRRVPGAVSAQEVMVNFHPFCPLEPGTEYTLEVPAGGLADYNGNVIEAGFQMTFTTAE